VPGGDEEAVGSSQDAFDQTVIASSFFWQPMMQQCGSERLKENNCHPSESSAVDEVMLMRRDS